MSWLSHFVFDPIKAAIARATTSSNPAVVAVANQASTTYNQLASQVSAASTLPLNANSAAGAANTAIGTLENGLNLAIEAFLGAALGAAGPVGQEVTPEVQAVTHTVLVFGEQHALTFVSALFSHAKAQVPAAQPHPQS